jgi:hypothetical protein
LPNIRELQTLIDYSRWNPASDPATFPNTPASFFWSNSVNAGSSTFAWGVNFGSGLSGYISKGIASYQVRLVRGGQPLGLMDVARPNSGYVDQGNGSVLHSPSGLIWQRCAIGQTWTGSACSGSASSMDWNAAQSLSSSLAGHSDWRLPTQEELLSLADYSTFSPAINASQFPQTPVTYFWSASTLSTNDAWYVDTTYGYTDHEIRGNIHQVRLVRAGKSFGPLTLTVNKSGVGQVSTGAMPGIECGPICDGGYYQGEVVILDVTPVGNLVSWGGACIGAGTSPTCTVTMDSAKAVTVTFVDTPVLSYLPANLSFDTQNIGTTSVSQAISLANKGTAVLAIASIAASGDFAVSNNCGGGLGVGGTCALDVTFLPTASGARSGMLTITTNAPGSPHMIALSGTGRGAVAQLSPSSLTFASQRQGSSSATQNVTLSNPGGAVLNISSITTTGQFAVSTTTCGATLAKSASCSVSVAFMPVTLGPVSGSLVISSNADVGTSSISLTGTGTPGPMLSLNPTSVSFAEQTLNTTSPTKSIQLTNSGAAALTLSLAASGDFSQSNNCGTGLGSGGFCTISVSFKPVQVGTRLGTITFTSNAGVSPYSMVLTGTGRSPNAPLCTLTATPSKVHKGAKVTLTANCNPQASTFTWSGGHCAGTTTNICVDTPSDTTVYTVISTNGSGSNTQSLTVKVNKADLTPILMLLLD